MLVTLDLQQLIALRMTTCFLTSPELLEPAELLLWLLCVDRLDNATLQTGWVGELGGEGCGSYAISSFVFVGVVISKSLGFVINFIIIAFLMFVSGHVMYIL